MIDEFYSAMERILLRMISILKLLEQRSETIAGIANTLKMSSRTIQRDLQTLKQFGFPLQYNPYTFEWDFKKGRPVPSLSFSQLETIALLVLFDEYGQEMDEPVFSAIKTVALKSAALLSPSFLDAFSGQQKEIHFKHSSMNATGDYSETFQTVLSALYEESVLQIVYKSPVDQKPLETRLIPYTVLYGRSWYVVGWSGLFREVRTFKISRILEIKKVNEKYKRPSNFSVEKYLGNAWSMIPERGKDYKIVLRFSPKVAQNVAEVLWHRTQKTIFLDDGRVELRFTVSGLSEIVWWILGYGSEVEVITPKKLRDLVAKEIRKMSDLYK
ncbi:MAG: transcriptional regulator [Planctomycetia bacterium]|nr:transcriptional regulator [Planctomycetia bacterium]